MIMLGLMARLPGRDRLLAKVMAPIQQAANAITLDAYGTDQAPAEQRS